MKIAAERRLLESQRELENDRKDREVQDARSESVRSLAASKVELAAAMHRHQNDYSLLRSDLEAAAMSTRSELIRAHAIETERITEIYRMDVQRMKQHLEVRHIEELAGVKQMHETELKRLLRESDRLKRVVARAGGVSSISSSALFTSTEPDPGNLKVSLFNPKL